MRLIKVHITRFQSIWDSSEFDIGDITCLVGKNESGKTALLKALYRLNPILESEGAFDATDDYPRRAVTDYQADVQAGRQTPARVVKATYAVEPDDMAAVEAKFGPNCLLDKQPVLTYSKFFSNDWTLEGLHVDSTKALRHLIENAGLPTPIQEQLLEDLTPEVMVKRLSAAEKTQASQQLTPVLAAIAQSDVTHYIFNEILSSRIPKFLYFDQYYQMTGRDNVETLRQRRQQNQLKSSDYPLVGLLELAGLDLDQVANTHRTEALIAKLEAAENQLTQRVLKHWSQNRHLRLKFDIRPAQPGDPPGMTQGMNIWGRVHDTKHMVSTALGTRSRGFVWFFSFLAWYSQLRRRGERLILLLDEPGLFLHAKAQEDLLRYFEDELRPYHQVIYTTHSPFMVDPRHFDRVRIVQDLSIDADINELTEEQDGTQVTADVLEATADSLFPLQGALGYEIYQTLFIGPNSLVVEGVSDLLYIHTISALLQTHGEPGLSHKWTITPVGGSDKVPTFVALIGAQTDLNVAVLVDYQKKDKQTIENLYKKKLLSKKKVLTYADFVRSEEADIEDMFDPEFYLGLVNNEYGVSVGVGDLPKGAPRIVVQLQAYFEENPLPKGAKYNHYRPARYFAENIGSLERDLTDSVLDRFRKAFETLNALL